MDVITFLLQLFSGDGFPRRWDCGDWSSAHGWIHILADTAIFAAYAAIPASIYYYVRKRSQVELPALWGLFAAFILSCGLTHLIDATIFWHPWYRLLTVVKAVTAIVSWATVAMILYHLPKLLKHPDFRALTQKLQSTEGSLAATLESIGEAVMATDAQGRITWMNPVAEQMTGWKREEAAGRPVEEVFHTIEEATRAPSPVPVKQVLTEGKSTGFTNHVALISRDQQERPIVECVTPIKASGNRIVGSVLVFRDISEERDQQLREKRRAAMIHRFQDSVLRLRDTPNPAWQDFYAMVTRECAETLEVEDACLWLEGISGTSWSLANCHTITPEASESPAIASDLDLKSLDLLFEGRDSVVCPATEPPPPLRQLLPQRVAGTGSLLAAPIRRAGKPAGLLCLHANAPERRWLEEEFQFLATVADKVAQAIEQRDRQQVETDLRESEQRFRDTFQFAATGLAQVATDGRWIRVNRVLCELLGYSEEELLKSSFLKITHPEDLDKDLDLLKATLAGQRQSYSMEKRYRHKSGSYFWALLTVSLIRDKDHQPLHFISAVQDISARKKAEEELAALNQDLARQVEERAARLIESEKRFSDLFEAAPDAMVTIDSRGVIGSVNQQAEHLFQHSRSALTGRPVTSLFSDLDESVLRDIMEGRADARRPADLKARSNDVEEIPVQVSFNPIESGDKRLVVAAIRDMTELEKARLQALRSQRLESVGRLAGGIAHDLNNALAPVLMGVEILRPELTEEAAGHLALIESSAQRGAEMVRHLLTFAHGSDEEKSPMRPGDLQQAIEQLIKATFPNQVRLDTRSAPDLPTILGNSAQLHQVLLNLCENAAEAMPDGGTLTLAMDRFSPEQPVSAYMSDVPPGDYLRITVSDTGIGIKPDNLDRIFDPFFSTKSPETGPGLGLATAVGAIKGHQGFIRVTSKLDQGSTFEVLIPAIPKSSNGSKPSGRHKGRIDGQGHVILAVDDEPAIRKSLKFILERLNFEVRVASEGKEALSILKSEDQRVSLLLTDVNMPNMDGNDLVTQARQIDPELPIIVMSGLNDSDRMSRFRQAGIQEFVSKPFELKCIANALEKALKLEASQPS